MTEAAARRQTPAVEQEFYAELGANVRRARGQMPQAYVAELLGLSRASVANIEAGRQPVSAWTLMRLVEILGVPTRSLLPMPMGDSSAGDLDLRGLDAAERRFVTAVSSKIPDEGP